MGKKEGSTVLLTSVIVSIVVSAAVALFLFSVPPVTSTSASLNTTPLMMQIVGPSSVVFNTFDLNCLGYELFSLFDAGQGLTNSLGGGHGLFNPGADIDFTTTTDFEDLAAPVADVMEFTDQDRALAADSISSVLFWNGVAGFVFGASLRLILSADL
jgi:hypothetical protein